ncbi:Serine/threonine-protein kinase 16 [Clonorchis sinensis]|uniref:non-specific serine/threonine protein kinase n=1 Tax=Clonorchis sinensis TaxID=79923 RepID=A0A419PWW4_CLOSI|nr:Serine/threonine-protein kinase 16 [Clonorchis sinensis]
MFGCWCDRSEKISVKNQQGIVTSFYVRDILDQGGFSTIELVSAASDRRNLLVLKRIRCHSKSDESKALSEARLHLSLPSHPNILPCVGTGMCPLHNHPQGAISEVFMVLDYCKRGSLLRELDSRQKRGVGGLPTHLAAKVCVGLCNALLVLLSLNVPMSHRDIKPGNVLLQDDWCPMLMDFGSCTPAVIEVVTYRDVELWKEFAAEHCSMAYRAPELFQPKVGENITEKADLWSLGCLLYALLFLESPMDRVHAKGDSVALAVWSAKIHFPTETSDAPPGMLNLIKSMLSVDPQARPSLHNVLEVLASFER